MAVENFRMLDRGDKVHSMWLASKEHTWQRDRKECKAVLFYVTFFFLLKRKKNIFADNLGHLLFCLCICYNYTSMITLTNVNFIQEVFTMFVFLHAE